MQSTDVSPADSSRASISAECTSDNLLQAASQLTAVGTSSAVSSEPASSDEGGRYAPAKRRIPRWKKKFLLAGLFSDYYKQDEYVNELCPKLILSFFFHRNGIIVTIYFQDKISLITNYCLGCILFFCVPFIAVHRPPVATGIFPPSQRLSRTK